MTALDKVILALVLFWAVVGAIRYYHWRKKERDHYREKQRPRPREMNKMN